MFDRCSHRRTPLAMAIRFSSSSLLTPPPPPFVSRSCRFSTPVSLSLLPSPRIFLKRLPSSLPHSTSMKRIYMVASEENPSLVAASPTPIQKKREYSLKKGQIVRVDKEKYLKSINYLSVGHPPYYKGLDYIYEDRGEVLDIRIFETGEYALIAWIGIPTSPAWLPTDMLIKSDKSSYKRT